MASGATKEHVATVLKALGESDLLLTVLPINWEDGTIKVGDVDYALGAPDLGLAEELATYINADND